MEFNSILFINSTTAGCTVNFSPSFYFSERAFRNLSFFLLKNRSGFIEDMNQRRNIKIKIEDSLEM